MKQHSVAPWISATTGYGAIVRAYWQGEVAAQSAALGRLRGLCARRGYGYDETVRALG